MEKTSAPAERSSIADEDFNLQSSTSEESSHAWTTEAEQTDEETEEDVELGVHTTREPDPEKVKFMSKGDWRHVRAAVKNIHECMSDEQKTQKKKKLMPGRDKIEKSLTAESALRRPGPWRSHEIFTWT